jgi:hypothetical protein
MTLTARVPDSALCRRRLNADCADLAIVPTFRLDCRRGKGFVVP